MGNVPSNVYFVEEVPAIRFEKGMFRVHYSTGRVDAFRPHDFMVAVQQAQTAIEGWFASGQKDPIEFRGAAGH